MSSHTVNLGAEVRTSDGHSIGKVKHLIVDSDRNTLASFVADKGLLDPGRVVDMVYVISSTDDEVRINLTEKEADDLAGFVQHEFVNVTGSKDAWLHLGPQMGDVPGTGSESVFAMPLPVNAQTRVAGPLDAEDVVLSKGTDVVDKIGDKIGSVDEIAFDEDGKISGFVVQQGFLFHHDVYVRAEWIAALTHEHVRLNVLKDEVERSKTS